MNGALIGTLICAAFGGVWAVAGATGLRRQAAAYGMTAGALIGLTIVVYAISHPPAAASGLFDGRTYGLSVAAEAIAILLALAILRRRRRRDLILPSVGLIVGLHFIGMWMAMDAKLYLVIAAAMSAVSLVAFALPGRNPAGFSARQFVAGAGCAAILWAAALATLA